MPQLCLYMMLQIMKPTELDLERGMQYILSVKKFYRRNPYHNFEHAFNVCHCMHLMLKRNPRVFTHIEVLKKKHETNCELLSFRRKDLSSLLCATI
jgi:cAMP and cAMP-inhibited cGMP 3',5'-cyclic phosphodiesterase 10